MPKRRADSNFAVDDAIAVLERTPAVFAALLAGLPDGWITADEGPDTFTPFDNVGHLIHGERTDWIPRARMILAQGANRTFEPYDRFAQVRESQGKTLTMLLTEFAALRAQNLATLREWKLGERELGLEGEHPALGRVSLRQLLWTAEAAVARAAAQLNQTGLSFRSVFEPLPGGAMEYASRTDRFIGQILDGIVAAIPAIAGIFLGAMVESMSGLFIVVGLTASCWYYFFADGFDNGQSFGKAWVGTRVIDRETRLACSYGQSFVRNLLLSLLGPIDWIFIFGDRHQRLGDMLAGTIVVPAPR